MNEPAKTLFKVIHFKIGPDDEPMAMDLDAEEEIEIGIFSTERKAQEAIDFLRDKPGFCKWPDGFRVFFCRLDEIGWEDGFFTPGVDDLDDIARSRGEEPEASAPEA